MKKILLILILIISTTLLGITYTAGYDYIYHVGKQKCLYVNLQVFTVGSFLSSGCTINGYDNAEGIIVLNCNTHPKIKGFIWFSKTLNGCKKIHQYIKSRNKKIHQYIKNRKKNKI